MKIIPITLACLALLAAVLYRIGDSESWQLFGNIAHRVEAGRRFNRPCRR